MRSLKFLEPDVDADRFGGGGVGFDVRCWDEEVLGGVEVESGGGREVRVEVGSHEVECRRLSPDAVVDLLSSIQRSKEEEDAQVGQLGKGVEDGDQRRRRDLDPQRPQRRRERPYRNP